MDNMVPEFCSHKCLQNFTFLNQLKKDRGLCVETKYADEHKAQMYCIVVSKLIEPT